MLDLLAQTDPKTFWNAPNSSTELWVKIVIALVLGFAFMAACVAMPARLRNPIVFFFTFVSGLLYVLYWLYPSPISRGGPADRPANTGEAISFWIADAQPIFAKLANTVAGFLIGLGIYSLLRIHGRKVFKQQRDWGFSLVLLVSLVAMAIFGYWDWGIRQTPAGAKLPFVPDPSWGFVQYARDLLFDGMLQQLDAVMFSLIAFFILSAAYRAFRARSTEATVLLVTALLVILNLMTVIVAGWNGAVGAVAGGNVNSPLMNLQLTPIALWIQSTLQVSSIRGLDFGVGIGLMAMGLRLWLSLEKIGVEA